MPSNRWIDQTQPQTLFMAVILLYLDAAFFLISHLTLWGLAVALGNAAAAYGIANEKKWGYGLGIAMAFLPLLALFIPITVFGGFSVTTLMLQIALVALLLHPQSREYQRIWFK